jgi:chromate reductase, NAD(P)H dehydrogenase (quinone)
LTKSGKIRYIVKYLTNLPLTGARRRRCAFSPSGAASATTLTTVSFSRQQPPKHIWDGLAFVPPFNEDLEAAPPPPAVAELRRAIEAADTVLIATPEYNGSVPGQLKNALDWASRPFRSNPLRGKPVAVIGASSSPRGAASAQAELRKVLRVIGARVIGPEFAVPRVHERFDADGRLSDDVVRARLRELLAELALATTPVVAAA